MAQLNETFFASEQEVKNFEPIPEGWYEATITGADLKTTKAGNGQYISVRYDITGPNQQGRVVFGNLNIRNPNIKAEEIGRQQLSSLLLAIGLANLNDTDQLVGNNLQIKLIVRQQEGFDPANDVKAFRKIGFDNASRETSAPNWAA